MIAGMSRDYFSFSLTEEPNKRQLGRVGGWAGLPERRWL